MKFNLLTKYIIIYILVAVIGFAAVTFIGYRIDYNKVLDSCTDELYDEANSIAEQYAAEYFSNEKLRIIERHLSIISKLGQTRIIFVSPNGDVILDTALAKTEGKAEVLYTIEDFNYADMGSKYYQLGNFYGTFNEKTLSVFAPITNSFTTKGYVVINMPESVIIKRVYDTFNTNYITLAIMLILMLVFPLLYTIQIHDPIKDITKATKEYGKGNLSYRLKPKYNDEIGHLAVSLDYMASKLNEMDKFQQKFLSNISHDFRSPLTSIKGYLEAIEDGTIPPEMINKYINIVLFETERLTKLTSNILSLNELDPKTVRLELTDFDLNSIIRHIVETFEGTCKKKNIKFDLTFAAETENVHADKEKIQQVIYNLIDNAIKFSPDNSFIAITVKERGEKAYISVKDNGCGIAKEDIDKIWDRFYKSDSSRGRDKKGSGLGLSITKEVIQAHEEHIDVISTPSVGTEFIFTLPLSK